jgi:hypothetical protein
MHTVKVGLTPTILPTMALPVPVKLRLIRPMGISLDVRTVVFGTVTLMSG